MFDCKIGNLHNDANLIYSEYVAADFLLMDISCAIIQNVAMSTGKTGNLKRVLAEGPVTIAK